MAGGIVHIKNMQSKLILFNIAFGREYSDVTLFVIVNFFISNCNLINIFT